jgi:hypothetical protein
MGKAPHRDASTITLLREIVINQVGRNNLYGIGSIGRRVVQTLRATSLQLLSQVQAISLVRLVKDHNVLSSLWMLPR